MKSFQLLLRFIIIFGLIILLLIPLMSINGVVKERKYFRQEAIERVSESKAKAQQWMGPLRIIPYQETRQEEIRVDDKGNKVYQNITTNHFIIQSPKTFHFKSELLPDERKVGLFKVPVYTLKASLEAEFADNILTYDKNITYGQPYLVFSVTDVRGLVGMPTLKVNNEEIELNPGLKSIAFSNANGIHALLPEINQEQQRIQKDNMETNTLLDKGIKLAMSFTLDGTRSISVIPLADKNTISMISTWQHPSFKGQFLPNERNIDKNGFKAEWAISALAANSKISQHIRTTDDLSFNLSTFDSIVVEMIDPIDVYTKADRASKYGILFIVLTFVGFILFELIKKLRIHPLQYLLVGLALAIFFLLLLSLSEHIEFWLAYLISAMACIGLQYIYLSGVLGSSVRAASFAAMLTALYGALYGLLISENNALLMGSLLLFGILALVMGITRKVDWYQLGKSE